MPDPIAMPPDALAHFDASAQPILQLCWSMIALKGQTSLPHHLGLYLPGPAKPRIHSEIRLDAEARLIDTTPIDNVLLRSWRFGIKNLLEPGETRRWWAAPSSIPPDLTTTYIEISYSHRIKPIVRNHGIQGGGYRQFFHRTNTGWVPGEAERCWAT